MEDFDFIVIRDVDGYAIGNVKKKWIPAEYLELDEEELDFE